MADEKRASESSLTVVDQREVEFYGDELTAVRGEDSRVYVVISHMCDALGIDAQGQTRRIKRQQVLLDGYTWVDILSTQGDVTQHRRVQALRVDLVPLWLTGISTRSIKDEETREKLLKYQKEAATVLWEAFQEGRLTADPAFSDLLGSDTPAVQAYKTALAVVEIARQQVLMESKLGEHERRLEAIEAAMGNPDQLITPSQASQISQAVKAIAMELSKQTGRNEYGGVYGELYRRFEITSYKLLPANRFEEAMEFLTEWHQSLTGDAPF